MIAVSHDKVLTTYLDLKKTCTTNLNIEPTQLSIVKSSGNWYVLVLYRTHYSLLSFYCSEVTTNEIQLAGFPVLGIPLYKQSTLYTVVEDEGNYYAIVTSAVTNTFTKSKISPCEFFIVRHQFYPYIECQSGNIAYFFDFAGAKVEHHRTLPHAIQLGDVSLTITATNLTLKDQFKTTTYGHQIDLIRYDGNIYGNKLTVFIISRNCIASELCSTLFYMNLDKQQIEQQDQSFSAIFSSEYLPSIEKPQYGWSTILKLIISFLLGSNLLVVLFWIWTKIN